MSVRRLPKFIILFGVSFAVSLALLGIVGPASASAYTKIAVRQYPICCNQFTQSNPDIDGDIVVWEDNRNSPPYPGSQTWDIYGYNLATGTEFPVVTLAGDQRTPSVSGNRVALVVEQSGFMGEDVKVYTLTGELVASKYVPQGYAPPQPRIDADTVVWAGDGTYDKSDTMLLDLDTRAVSLVTDASLVGPYYFLHYTYAADISGDQVVVLNGYGSNWGIYGIDLTSHDDYTISPSPYGSLDRPPRISNDKVVWVRDDSVLCYDVALRTTTTLDSHWASPRGNPVVSENLVAWYEGGTVGRSGIEVYDLATGQKSLIPEGASALAVSGNTVVWSAGGDVFGAEIVRVEWAGAVQVESGAPWTDETIVNLQLSASSSAGPVTDMRLSADGASWSDWIPYVPSATFSLPPSDGEKTVYVEFRDSEGNVSDAATDTILLDTTPPSVHVSGADTSWHNHPVSLTLSAIDIASGVYCIWWSHDEEPIWHQLLGSQGSVVVPAPSDHSWDGFNSIWYCGQDNLGNVPSSVTQRCVVKIDTLGPRTRGLATSGRRNHAMRLQYEVMDALSPRATDIRIVVRNSHGIRVKTFRPTSKATSTWYSVKWTPKARGTYRYYVSAQDLAGNPQTLRGSAKIVVR